MTDRMTTSKTDLVSLKSVSSHVFMSITHWCVGKGGNAVTCWCMFHCVCIEAGLKTSVRPGNVGGPLQTLYNGDQVTTCVFLNRNITLAPLCHFVCVALEFTVLITFQLLPKSVSESSVRLADRKSNGTRDIRCNWKVYVCWSYHWEHVFRKSESHAVTDSQATHFCLCATEGRQIKYVLCDKDSTQGRWYMSYVHIPVSIVWSPSSS